MLSQVNKYSIRALENSFHKFLAEDPPKLPLFNQSQYDEAYLLVDGKWFDKRFVVIAYRQAKSLFLLHVSVAGREVSTKIARDLRYMKDDCHYRFTGIVSDGGKGVVSAIKEVYPHAPHQICLAHMHRDMVNAIGKRPQDPRINKLKRFVDHVWLIESKEALKWWLNQVKSWFILNLDYLLERRYDTLGKWWFVHKGPRKVIKLLLILPEISFTFLSHPLMSKTTNELEAQFGHLGKRWLTHKGLKRQRWEQFLKWFVYFYNRNKLS